MSVSNRLQTKLQTKRDAEEKRARLRKGCIQVAAGLVGFGFVAVLASACGNPQSRLPLYTPEPYVSKFNTSHTYVEPAVEEPKKTQEECFQERERWWDNQYTHTRGESRAWLTMGEICLSLPKGE